MAGFIGAGLVLAIVLGAPTMRDNRAVIRPECAGTVGDREYAWKVASGPKGERDPAAIPLFEAVIDGNETALKHILESGQSPEQRLYSGRRSALMIAAQSGCRGSVQLFLDHGADLNYEADDDSLTTALNVALTHGVWDCMSIFYDLL